MNRIHAVSFLRVPLFAALVAVFVSGVERTAGAEESAAFSKLSVVDGRIVDESGEEVTLRGVNTGNWFVLEMWMLDAAGGEADDQHKMEEAMTERFGAAEMDRLMEIFRENWITQKDFAIVKSFDMNVVRLPFEADLLMESMSPPKLKPDGWKWLDRAIEMAEAEGLYTILDLHGAPGRQSGMDHTGRREYNRLWSEEYYQDATVWLWEQIALRYKDRKSIAAYDFLNEPWGGEHEQLDSLISRLYDTVRVVGDDTIIILPGFHDGIDFYGDPREKDWTNYIFTMHYYPGFFGWGRADWPVHKDFLDNGLYEWKDRMVKLGVPLLVGEFNVVLKKAGGGEMMRRYYDRYEEWGWPATMWSYKVLKKNGGVGTGVWGMVTNAEPFEPLDVTTWSAQRIEEYFSGLSSDKLEIDEDLRHWMTTDEAPSELPEPPPPPPKVTVAPAMDDLPDGWTATDIGGALAGGQRVDEDGSLEIFGAGHDIYGTSDGFRFVWQKVRGDFEISAKVRSLDDVHTYAKAGVMARASLAADSPHVLLNVFPVEGYELGWRVKQGGSTQTIGDKSLPYSDIVLRLSRRGATISAEYLQGEELKSVKEFELPALGDEVFLGLATLSHDDTQLVAAKYSNVSIDAERIEATPEDIHDMEEQEEESAAAVDQTSTGGSAQEKNTYARSLDFAGRHWSVKAFDVPAGPGGNFFSDDPDHVWVDDRGLHLTIKKAADKWWCTEVILQETLGYGTYIFHTDSDIDNVSPDVVLGLFTWDNYGDGPVLDPPWPYREIDIEFARWGDPNRDHNTQFTIQPWNGQGTSHGLRIGYPDPGDKKITVMWTWTEDACKYVAARGHVMPDELTEENVLERWTYDGKYLQPAGRENVRMNYWIFQGKPPAVDRENEFVINNFAFIPAE